MRRTLVHGMQQAAAMSGLHRLADRLLGRLVALPVPGLVTIVNGGKTIWVDGRRMVRVAVRARRGAVRVDLMSGWPWPRRRIILRSATGGVMWVRDERTLRVATEVVRRTLWRARRTGGL